MGDHNGSVAWTFGVGKEGEGLACLFSLALLLLFPPAPMIACWGWLSKVWEAAQSQSPLWVRAAGPRGLDPRLPFLGPEPMCLVGQLCLACWVIFNNVNV